MSAFKLQVKKYGEFEKWFDKMMTIRSIELSEHILTGKIPETVEYENEVYRWNPYKDNWQIEREVDWKEFTKKHNLPLLDPPVACYEIQSLSNAVKSHF